MGLMIGAEEPHGCPGIRFPFSMYELLDPCLSQQIGWAGFLKPALPTMR